MNYKNLLLTLITSSENDFNWLNKIYSNFSSDQILSNLDNIQDLIRSKYITDKDLQNCFSKIGVFLIRKTKNINKALNLFSIDYQLDRQTWYFTLQYAEALFINGQILDAQKLINETYMLHDEAKNGFANIAFNNKNKWLLKQSPFEYALQDINRGRCTPGFKINIATMATIYGLDRNSEKLILESYKDNDSLLDGFSRCGWEKYSISNKIEDLVNGIENDLNHKRASVFRLLSTSYHLSKLNIINQSNKYFEEALLRMPFLSKAEINFIKELAKPPIIHKEIIKYITKLLNGKTDYISPLIHALKELINNNLVNWKQKISDIYQSVDNLEDCHVDQTLLLNPDIKSNELFIESAEEDLKYNKISISRKSEFINILILDIKNTFKKDNIEETVKKAKHLYSLDNDLEDILVNLVHEDELPLFIELGTKDLTMSRISPKMMLKLAFKKAQTENNEESLKIIKMAYECDSSLKGAYTKLAKILIHKNEDIQKILGLLNLEIKLKRNNHSTLKLYTSITSNLISKQNSLIYNIRANSDFIKNSLFSPKCYPKTILDDSWLSEAKDLHKGKRCFMLATGPSLNKVDLNKLKGEILFGVNGTYRIDNIDLTYFVYVSSWFWKHHLEGIKNVRCNRRFLPSSIPQLNSNIPTSWLNVDKVNYTSIDNFPLPVPSHFSFEPDKYIFAGGTVLYLCFQLAYYMGFSKVITLGLDHSYNKNIDKDLYKHSGGYVSENNSHFLEDYNPPDIEYHVDLEAMERSYKISNKIFQSDGRVIVNASPGTKLDVFEKVDYESLFN